MAVKIVIINKDKTETDYNSVDVMPAGSLKEEIKTVLSYNTHNTGLTTIYKIMQ